MTSRLARPRRPLYPRCACIDVTMGPAAAGDEGTESRGPVQQSLHPPRHTQRVGHGRVRKIWLRATRPPRGPLPSRGVDSVQTFTPATAGPEHPTATTARMAAATSERKTLGLNVIYRVRLPAYKQTGMHSLHGGLSRAVGLASQPASEPGQPTPPWSRVGRLARRPSS